MANYNYREFTFAVSEPYLRRLQALVDDSGTRPVGTAYRKWVSDAVPSPDLKLRDATPDIAITVVLKLPFSANPATIWTAAIAGVVAGLAIVILVASAVVCHATE